MVASLEPSLERRAREALWAWYRPRRRAYPWRGPKPDPYRVLVSEVMLQQTQAPRVVPSFEAFIARFPGFGELAEASRADVLREWAGLGYHRRAVRLHEAARVVVRDHGGRLPADPQALRALPGIGPYTASAIASIAYGVPVAAVDTNARRIAARVVHGAEPDEITPAAVTESAQAMLDRGRPGNWNQAVMDLGREVCRPRPRCERCPLAPACAFREAGRQGRPSSRLQSSFEGSFRQVRGRVLAILRERESVDVRVLAREVEDPRASDAIAALVDDGLAERSGRRARLAV